MHLRAVAAERLWHGIVDPSDDSWRDGARRLGVLTPEPEMLTPGKTPVPKVGVLLASLRDLGERAATEETKDARAAVYAEAIATCAACHQ
jgi:mono/diheme cytochrome c family protein